jgi:predicted DNA-binding transcriptional regulator AlpA
VADWMTPAEIAEEIHFSRATVYKLMERDPTFPKPFRPNGPGGWPRFRRDQVLAWKARVDGSAQASEEKP